MEEQYQQAIRYWTLAQPVVSAYVAAVVGDFRDRDDVLQAISVAVLEAFASYDLTFSALGPEEYQTGDGHEARQLIAVKKPKKRGPQRVEIV